MSHACISETETFTSLTATQRRLCRVYVSRHRYKYMHVVTRSRISRAGGSGKPLLVGAGNFASYVPRRQTYFALPNLIIYTVVVLHSPTYPPTHPSNRKHHEIRCLCFHPHHGFGLHYTSGFSTNQIRPSSIHSVERVTRRCDTDHYWCGRRFRLW